MHKLSLATGAAFTLAFTLACGGTDLSTAGLSGGFDNVAACEAYVDKHNSLECTKDMKYEASEMCPSALDMNPSDMSPMYDCMVENAKCDGAIPDFGGLADCSDLL